jgi:hypothetical protein
MTACGVEDDREQRGADLTVIGSAPWKVNPF